MPQLVLTRALTYEYLGHSFKRGEVRDVPLQVYNDLIRRGVARDPNQQIDFVAPEMIRHARPGSVVPVIRDVGIGDVLMVTIPLRDYAERNKHVRILYAVDPRYVGMFRGMGFCEVRGITELHGSFQWGVDLRGYCERAASARNMDRIDVFSQHLLGGPPSSYDYPLRVLPGEREIGRKLAGMDDGGDRPTLGLVLRASLPNRSWGIEYNARLAEIATKHGWGVVLLDNKVARSQHDPPWSAFFRSPVVDLTGRVNVEQLKAVVAAVDVVVSPDTGTLHLAEAVGTRCVGYFTTVPPELRAKHYRWTRVLYPEGQLPCLGCIHSPRCGLPDPKPCANLTTPEMAWEQVLFVHENEPPWPLVVKRERACGRLPELARA